MIPIALGPSVSQLISWIETTSPYNTWTTPYS